jgi:hypothetical protein
MNDEARMTDDEGNPKPEWRRRDDTIIRHFFRLGHLDFVIPSHLYSR